MRPLIEKMSKFTGSQPKILALKQVSNRSVGLLVCNKLGYLENKNSLLIFILWSYTMGELFGKTIFKKDKNKPLTEEQIVFMKSYTAVEIEIQDDRIIVLSQTGELSTNIATEIAQKFHRD
jgi:hypothetical protein